MSDTPASSSSLGGDTSGRPLRRLACVDPAVPLGWDSGSGLTTGVAGATSWSVWVGTGVGAGECGRAEIGGFIVRDNARCEMNIPYCGISPT